MLSGWVRDKNYGLDLAVCFRMHKTENVSNSKSKIKEKQLWLNLDFELDAPRFGVES